MGIDNRYGAVQRLLLLTYPSACWKLSLHLFQFIDKLFWFLQSIARPGGKLRNLRLAQWLEAGHEVAILEDCKAMFTSSAGVTILFDMSHYKHFNVEPNPTFRTSTLKCSI